MRSELEQIETIERYLEGKMSGGELSSFESKMNSDVAFQQDVAQQSLIVDRVNNMAKMQAIEVAHQNHTRRAAYKGWAIKGVIGITAITAAIAGGKVMADWSNEAPTDGQNVALVADSEDSSNEANSIVPEKTKSYSDAPLNKSDKSKNESNETNQTLLTEVEQEDTTKGKKAEAAKQKEEAASTDKKESTSADTKEKSSQKKEGFRKKGAKMYLVSDDANAKLHFERELGIYDTWKLVEKEEDAKYKLKLRYKKQGLDRLSWIEIIDIKSGDQVYRSIQSRGFNGGMRTVNLKQASIEQLVHEILAYEFFGME